VANRTVNKNDNDHDLVLWVQDRLQAHDPLQKRLETQRLCGARMQNGNPWKSGTKKQSQKSEDRLLSSVTLDMIGPQLRHLEGRLSVWDLSAGFTSAEPERQGTLPPEMVEKLGMARSWYWRWLPGSRLVERNNDMIFRSIVCGYDAMMWHFVDDHDPKRCRRTNGIELDYGPTPRLTVDTTNYSQDVLSHEFMIVTQVMSVEDASAKFAARLKEKGRVLRSGTPMGELIASDAYLDSGLYSRMPGAFQSKTMAVVVHWVFTQHWEKIGVIIYSPPWRDGATRTQVDAEWHVVVVDKDWAYGCPILKYDCYKNASCWCGDSMVVNLTPWQRILGLAINSKVRSAWLQAMVKILVQSNAISGKSPERLRSNVPFEIVEVDRTVRPSEAVHLLQFPRGDDAWTDLMRVGITEMYRGTSLNEALQGQGQAREPASGYAERVRQSLMSLEPRAASIQTRLQTFVGGMVDAALRYHGENTDRVIFGGMVGENHAGTALEVAKTRRVVRAGDILCKMRDQEFLPQSVEEIDSMMFQLLKAGRFSPDSPEWAMQRFLLTHRETEAGQWASYQEANIVISECLQGNVPEIFPHDPLLWFQYEAQAHLGCSRSRGYTKRQRQALEATLMKCDDLMHVRAALSGATKQIAGGVSPGAGSGASSAPLPMPTGPTTPPGATSPAQPGAEPMAVGAVA
jgi:hypothetical protein